MRKNIFFKNTMETGDIGAGKGLIYFPVFISNPSITVATHLASVFIKV